MGDLSEEVKNVCRYVGRMSEYNEYRFICAAPLDPDDICLHTAVSNGGRYCKIMVEVAKRFFRNNYRAKVNEELEAVLCER